jgi:hypothetical protein
MGFAKFQESPKWVIQWVEKGMIAEGGQEVKIGKS